MMKICEGRCETPARGYCLRCQQGFCGEGCFEQHRTCASDWTRPRAFVDVKGLRPVQRKDNGAYAPREVESILVGWAREDYFAGLYRSTYRRHRQVSDSGSALFALWEDLGEELTREYLNIEW